MSTIISVDEKQLHKLIGDRNQCQDKITSMQHACNKELERRRAAETTVKDLKGIINRAMSIEHHSIEPIVVIDRMMRVLCEVDDII